MKMQAFGNNFQFGGNPSVENAEYKRFGMYQ
jgi:hypothetical protein